MNEFNSVSSDELNQIDGGGIWRDLVNAVKTVVKEVVQVIKSVPTGRPIT